ncbi:MAG: hypothetical protein RLZZ53_1109 [Acidobacteriota bacterium]|jgi:uncharacterized phiE125 gp8 family phage protein
MAVPLSTIKSALKIEYADDDLDLMRLRDAASSLIERETGLCFNPAKRDVYLANWTATAIPFVPFTSVQAVTYQNASNVTTTMPVTDWWLDRTDGPLPVIRFLEAPAIYEGTQITVGVNCGYEQLPNEIVHAIISLTGAWYNNPEAFQPIGLTAVPMSLQFIMDSFRVREMLR